MRLVLARRLEKLFALVLLGLACSGNAGDGTSRVGPRKAAEPSVEAPPAPAPPVIDPAGLPEAVETLARGAAAVGGVDRLAALRSFHAEGVVTVSGQGIEGRVEEWWERAGFYMAYEIPGVGLSEVGRRGDLVWMRDPVYGLRRVEGREAEQIHRGQSLSLAADWRQYFVSARTTAVRRDGSTDVIEVELVSAGGDRVALIFDVGTHLQIEQRFSQVTPMGEMPITVLFSDYRDVGGIKVAFRQESRAPIAVMVQQITRFELDAEVDPGRFEMPASDPKPHPAAAPEGRASSP